MVDIRLLKFHEISTMLEQNKITCVQIMQQVIENINKFDGELESFITIEKFENLLSQAEESDKRLSKGKKLSELDGIPIAIKDNIHVMGMPTTCGSGILKGYNPPYDATVIEKIKAAGGIIVGKTNLDEFAMGSTCENSSIITTKNPWDISRVPGGSSGGSAAAVSAGMCLLALGSDTGGSVRQPASFCGVVGLKPTYGLVSRFGLVAYASSLDQIGTFSTDVYGASLLLELIGGGDTKDSTSLEKNTEDYTKKITNDNKNYKLAYFPEFLAEGVSDDVKKTFNDKIKQLEARGISVEKVEFPELEYVISTYYFIATAEASSNLSRYDGVKYGYRSNQQKDYEKMLFSTRSDGFGHEVKKRIMLGNFVLSSGYYDAYYGKAQKLRTFIMKRLQDILKKYDALITPTTIDKAFKLGESESDPLKMYLSDVTTVLPNLCGLPAISLPAGLSDGMPLGLQLIGRPLGESELFSIASFLEAMINQAFVPDLTKIANKKKKQTLTGDNADSHSGTRYSKELITKISGEYNSYNNNSNRVLCGDLENHVGKKVEISGSIYRISNLGGIEFFTLNDRTGMTQLVFEGEQTIDKITLQSIITVRGEVTKEDRSPFNNIEIKVESFEMVSTADSDIPINVSSQNTAMNLPTILDNRAISLRNDKIRSVFTIQAEIINLFSEFLRKQGFTEIKTPKIIANGTEGGTNIFEIKYFDKQAFLAQSPQFYKQMMVGSGLERVFEVAPVFRAEKHNTIRHLNEYISLDFEMGYIQNEMDVIEMHESVIKYILTGLKEKHTDIISQFVDDFTVFDKIPKLHFIEALEIIAELGIKDMDGDISPEGEKLICNYAKEKWGTSFVYIIGYPVKKRPMYTMEDERLPGYTRSFDLLYNGLEITTGGQRIHNYKKLRENIIEFGGNPRNFTDYLAAFKYGMPPHGGLGMGLERLTMKLLGLGNVREASLFPRDIGRLAP